MCGICGIYNIDGRPVDRDLLERMNNTMVHRGPDGDGYFINAGRQDGLTAGRPGRIFGNGRGNVGLGHRRLSIIDLSTGDQPMGNEDGSIQVVFNGEIYNFLELRDLLEQKGHRFRTKSDTESIIHGYEQWGEDFVKHLRGMFAIALWDKRNRTMILARDRVGKKPLYYFHDKNRLLFASELKALLEDRRMPGEMDLKALDCYVSFGYVPSPMSIFTCIRKLPPASYAVCNESGFAIHSYWRLDMENPNSEIGEKEAGEALRELFDESVRLRMISDVPIGAFLSGGVDSSAVVASMARLSGNGAVKTASIGFSDEKFDELEFAGTVADLYGTDHTEYRVEPDALQVINDIVWHLDEPFADASAIPTYYVSKMARQKVTVAISGDGGDETFAGYVRRYHMNRVEDRVRRMIPPLFRENVFRPLSTIYPRLDAFPRPFRLKNFLSSISRSFEDAYFRDMSFYFLPEMKQKLYRPELTEALKNHTAFEVLGRHFRTNQNPDPTTRAQYVDIKTYLPEDILVKVDRMSMANSLEVRSPLLDHKILEFAGRLPSSLKLKGMESKYILKKIFEDRLPKKILYRKKQGFCVPLAGWLRGGLKGFAETTLFSNEAKIYDYLSGQYVRKLWDGHQKGRQDYANPLWNLMMLELWHRRFLGGR